MYIHCLYEVGWSLQVTDNYIALLRRVPTYKRFAVAAVVVYVYIQCPVDLHNPNNIYMISL